MLTVAGLMLNASGQQPAGSAEQTADAAQIAIADSLARLDSIRHAEAAGLVTKATDSHRNLKRIQYDGTTEAELYPLVLSVHGDVLAALGNDLVEGQDRTQLRGILLDLDPLLIRGASYYSAQGDRASMTRYARACVDTRIRPDMKDMPYGSASQQLYPSIVYCAASDAYNAGDYENAMRYFVEFLDGDGTERRDQIAMFYGQAAINTGKQAEATERLIDAANRYPTNYNLLMITLQNCLDAGEHDKMQPLMDRALAMHPDDEQLITVQAALLEDVGNFDGALTMYSRLYDLHPESMSINKHLALCYYNLGAEHYNMAISSGEDEKTRKRNMRQAKAYFLSAATKLGAVVDNDPGNAKYLKALAMTYGCLGETTRLSEINTRLSALGMKPVTVTGMPETVNFSDNATAAKGMTIPSFPDFARGFVDQNIARFATRGEFERTEDFEKRMSQENFDAEYERLVRQAEQDYLRKYGSRLRISDLTLEPYDIDNETYRINSAMGPVILKVPYKDKEAETFKSGWNGVQVRNPRYFIRDNMVAIAAVDFVTPSGKTYSYKADDEAPYDYHQLIAGAATGPRPAAGPDMARADSERRPATKVVQVKSDVDREIPITSRKAEKTVALIWANENYKNVTTVSGATNDGESFAEYCRRTLGIPDAQVIDMRDVTYAEMLTSMRRLRQITGTLGDGVDLIFYYAGHGIPDEATKDAFLLPVDGDGVTTAATYPIKQLYSDLAATRADNVMVFLDACFSGASRDGGMLAEARGVALKPRQADPEGSMFVLSAATDSETALPYKEKNHGMFTYYLLKKLQLTKGNATLQEIADYVTDNVKKSSLSVNRKSQTPTMKVSGRLATQYKSKKLRP